MAVESSVLLEHALGKARVLGHGTVGEGAARKDAPGALGSPGTLRLLVVGASAELRQGLEERLSLEHWTVTEARSGAEAIEALFREPVDVLLVCAPLPDLDTGEFRFMVERQFAGVQILDMNESGASSVAGTGSHAMTELREALKPVSRPSPPIATAPLALMRPVAREPGKEASRRTGGGWGGMVGSSAAMERVYHAARLVARRETTVLIQGESGTGKELVARAIHTASNRDKQPFVAINCAAIPEPLLEAELFGYTKGAFTGAAQSRIGRIHAAHGGTLFLDEIGDMPYPLQSKILRFLEQGEVQRIGGTDTLKVDCRVLAATNADLRKLSKQNLFREDLYYRLAVFPIALPPLRDRVGDLAPLAEAFLARFCPGTSVSPEAWQLLQAHDWPGNVRELRNVLERASVFAEGRGEILAEDVVL